MLFKFLPLNKHATACDHPPWSAQLRPLHQLVIVSGGRASFSQDRPSTPVITSQTSPRAAKTRELGGTAGQAQGLQAEARRLQCASGLGLGRQPAAAQEDSGPRQAQLGMTAARAANLEAISFAFAMIVGAASQLASSKNAVWEAQLAKLKMYTRRHDDCSVPWGWVEDPPLGVWVHNQRRQKKKLDRGEPSEKMTAARAAKVEVEVLGFAWELSPAALSKQYPKEECAWSLGSSQCADALDQGPATRQLGQLSANAQDGAGPRRAMPRADGGARGEAGGARLRVVAVLEILMIRV
jgi:hypothetical protein